MGGVFAARVSDVWIGFWTLGVGRLVDLSAAGDLPDNAHAQHWTAKSPSNACTISDAGAVSGMLRSG